MFYKNARIVIAIFILLTLASVYFASSRLRFSFDLQSFFPTEDPDLEFYNEFKERFEPDDNFLLVAIRREEGIFDQAFLKKVLAFSNELRDLEFPISSLASTQWHYNKSISIDIVDNKYIYRARPILSVYSILQVEYPIKTPFTFTSIPAIHIDEPERYEADKKRILADARFVHNLVSEDGKTLVIVLKTVDNIQQEPAEKLIAALKERLKKANIEEYHFLGRAYFQTELVAHEIQEFIFSSIVSLILVFLVMFLIFGRLWGVLISMLSIGLGLIIFIGILGLLGRELDTMALLYPIIMIIVGTSDVIHVMSKYTDELQKGNDKVSAIKTTVREIGLSVFLTSFTTAIGFLSLVSSRLDPIRNFGLNAALGVMVAYATVLIFTTTVLTLFDKDQIIKPKKDDSSKTFWHKSMHLLALFTKKQSYKILIGALALMLICAYGISRINTNTQIEKILPKGTVVTKDFFFFEKEFSGFRPYEIAVSAKGAHFIDEYELLSAMSLVEDYVKTFPAIRTTSSITDLYKSMHQAHHGNNHSYYKMPREKTDFLKYQKLLDKLNGSSLSNKNILLSKDRKYARISARMLDVGADSIDQMTQQIRNFIDINVDSNLIEFKQTGTGVIVDKNSEYIRNSLLQGLGFAIVIICIMMALLYRDWKMLLVALVPNLMPLVIAGAILGFTGIPLEAGVAIVFAIIFGIAVDDTIHLLGRFRILKSQGLLTEEAIRLTLLETGKAIILTSLILFFGFLILLFSASPPAITIGLLISMTLISALVCDLLMLPILLRWLVK